MRALHALLIPVHLFAEKTLYAKFKSFDLSLFKHKWAYIRYIKSIFISGFSFHKVYLEYNFRLNCHKDIHRYLYRFYILFPFSFIRMLQHDACFREINSLSHSSLSLSHSARFCLKMIMLGKLYKFLVWIIFSLLCPSFSLLLARKATSDCVRAS